MDLLKQSDLKVEYLWIALGSALGGAGRYWLSGVIAQRFGEAFPVGTLIDGERHRHVPDRFDRLDHRSGRTHVDECPGASRRNKNRVLQSGGDFKDPGNFRNQYNSGITWVFQLQPVPCRN